MSAVGGVLLRIAAATSVIRTRSEDGVRTDLNGGANGTLKAREVAVIARLEQVAEKLEKALS